MLLKATFPATVVSPTRWGESRLGLGMTHICYLPITISLVCSGGLVSSREKEALRSSARCVEQSVAWRNKECLVAKMLLCA